MRIRMRVCSALTVGAVALAVVLTQARAQVPEAARTPIVVPGLDDVVDAAVGDHFFIVARRDGTVLSWGYNNLGQLGNGRVGSTAGGEPGKTMGFVVEGTVAPVAGLTEVIGVAAGTDYALAVRRDGSVWGWGSNGSGQLALGKANHAGSPRAVAIPGISKAAAVAAYGRASYALLDDGSVLGRGDGLWRVGGRPVSSETPIRLPGVTGVTAIRAGLPCLALLGDGGVVAWGSGYLGDGSPPQRDYAAVVVPQPAHVSGIDDAVAIATGGSRSGVIRRDGTVWVWGDDSLGGLGLGKPAGGNPAPERREPVKIPNIATAKDLALASGSTIVLGDGTMRTWGDERLGATARAGIERVAAPTEVPGVATLVRVWAHAYSNLGLTRDGHLLAWGSVYVKQ